MTGFLPTSSQERSEMLACVGLPAPERLFDAIPADLRLAAFPDCPELARPWSEMEIIRQLQSLAGQNLAAACVPSFLGAGAYDHYQPAALRHLLLRQEFYTAYTPYQPEISQGTLQGIFEFQSLICRLTEMDVANSSMYDGASAAAEALLMACRATGRKQVVIAGTVNPQTWQVIKTYLEPSGHTVTVLPAGPDGTWAPALAAHPPAADTAAVLVQSPNYFGLIEDLPAIAALAHEAGSLAVASCDPVSLALLATPGSAGIDIAAGEVQPLGNALSFGGPYVGYLAARENLLRRMPGRICGETADHDGRRAFVLTIQAREQHIRRDKATSNICTSQALCALAATIHLSLLGGSGLREVARQSANKAAWLRQRLLASGWFSAVHDRPFFREFAVRLQRDRWPADLDIAGLNRYLAAHQVVGGLDLGLAGPEVRIANGWLLAVTEKRSREDIDLLLNLIGAWRRERGADPC